MELSGQKSNKKPRVTVTHNNEVINELSKNKGGRRQQLIANIKPKKKIEVKKKAKKPALVLSKPLFDPFKAQSIVQQAKAETAVVLSHLGHSTFGGENEMREDDDKKRQRDDDDDGTTASGDVEGDMFHALAKIKKEDAEKARLLNQQRIEEAEKRKVLKEKIKQGATFLFQQLPVSDPDEISADGVEMLEEDKPNKSSTDSTKQEKKKKLLFEQPTFKFTAKVAKSIDVTKLVEPKAPSVEPGKLILAAPAFSFSSTSTTTFNAFNPNSSGSTSNPFSTLGSSANTNRVPGSDMDDDI